MKKLVYLILCAAAIQSSAADFEAKIDREILTLDLRQCDGRKSVFMIKPEVDKDNFFEIKMGKNIQHISSVSSDGNAHAETNFDGGILKISSIEILDQDLGFDFQITNNKISFEKGIDLIPGVRIPEIHIRNDFKKIILKRGVMQEVLFGKCIVKFGYK